MTFNDQRQIRLSVAAARDFTRRLRRALRLGKRDFNVCFVSDARIEQMNRAYRGQAKPTDVLSFPWESWRKGAARPRPAGNGRRPPKDALDRVQKREFANFLGDIVISVEMARRNARLAGHSSQREIRGLILHGVLHLLGYDHKRDHGEMAARESRLRACLGV